MSDPLPRLADDRGADDLDDYIELLALIGQDFAQSLDLDATLRVTLTRIMDYLEAEAASLFLVEDDGRDVVCRVSVGASDITGMRLRYGQGIVGQSIAEQTSLMIRDVRADPRFFRTIDDRTGFTTRSILCAPLSIKDEHLGAIEVVNKRGGDGLFRERDRQALRVLAASAAMAIRNAALTRDRVEQQRVQRELELVAELQQSLLPKPRPAPFPVHGLNMPARTVSGDFYDFFPIADGRILFTLGDVAGKGVQAVLLMTKASSLVRCLGKTVHQPGRLLGMVNREVCETAARGMFVTMVVGLYDPQGDTVTIANAGHEPPLHLARDGTFREYPAEAPPAGISAELFPDECFPEVEIAIDGGGLYVFSDGLTEGRAADGEAMGVERLKPLLADLVHMPPPARLAAVAGRFMIPGEPLHDDLTMLIVEKTEGT